KNEEKSCIQRSKGVEDARSDHEMACLEEQEELSSLKKHVRQRKLDGLGHKFAETRPTIPKQYV
ncbi:15478_t:CDS:2, partial [Dentiscutata erythropus]